MPPRKSAFSLVELLVVVGIISLLVGLLAPSLVRARVLARAAKWATYASGLKKDPDTVLYFDFAGSGGSLTVSNCVATVQSADPRNTSSKLTGQVQGAFWAPSRWADAAALRFTQPADSLQFGSAGVFDVLTLATWVNVTASTGTFQGLQHSDGWAAEGGVGKLHWNLIGDRVRFSVYGNSPVDIDSAGTISSSYGKWMHLAAVYDARQRTLRVYINGELDSARTYSSCQSIVLGPGRLGNWNGQPRPLNGRMDEFVALQRGLSDSEIKTMHEQGKPP